MEDHTDSLKFGQNNKPSAGVYTSPALKKTGPLHKDGIEISGPSIILGLSSVQNAFETFGLEGLKSIMLQELVKLEPSEIEEELKNLARGAGQNQTVKRALRATKILAATWMADPRQQEDIRERCTLIFETIPTFGTHNLKLKRELAQEQADAQEEEAYYPLPHPPNLPPLAVECVHPIEENSSIVYVTDIQGHYNKLEMLLQTCNLAHPKGSYLHWDAPDNIYLVLVGDLFNKSPYSTWGDGIGFQSFEIIETIRRIIAESGNRVMVCYGNYDIDLATKAAFYHPISGFTGSRLGVNAQAQTLPIVFSFLKGTGFEEADHPYSAWTWDVSDEGNMCFKLKPEYQIKGKPDITLPATPAGDLDLQPILDFYERIYQFVVPPNIHDRPKTIKQIDERVKQFLPQPTDNLNLNDLAHSMGRRALVEGLLEGTGTISFLRKNLAGLHVFQTKKHELFAAHIDMLDRTLDNIEYLKESDKWSVPDLIEFLKNSKELKKRRIQPKVIVKALKELGLTSLTKWLGLPARELYKLLINNKKIQLFVPSIIRKKDEAGFCDAYNQLRYALMAEDPGGMAGFYINQEGLPRRGEPLMEKVSHLDERAKIAYCKKFLLDVFQQDIPFGVGMLAGGEIVAQFPSKGENPEFKISLLIDESAAVYKDTKKVIHIPIKHAAWIEYH